MPDSEPTNSIRGMLPDEELPWVFRLRPAWGWILTFIFGGAAVYGLYVQLGPQSLHGIWISVALLMLFYGLRDYVRLRLCLSKFIIQQFEPDITSLRDKLAQDFVANASLKETRAALDRLAASLKEFQVEQKNAVEELDQKVKSSLRSSEGEINSRFSAFETKLQAMRDTLDDARKDLRIELALDKALFYRYDHLRAPSPDQALRQTLGSYLKALEISTELSGKNFSVSRVDNFVGDRLRAVEDLIRRAGSLDHDEVSKLEKIMDAFEEKQPTRVKRLKKIIEEVGD